MPQAGGGVVAPPGALPDKFRAMLGRTDPRYQMIPVRIACALMPRQTTQLTVLDK
jgi:hypothetical protein